MITHGKMTLNDYQHFAARTINRLCDNLTNTALGLAGEAGEVADLIKKVTCQGHDLDELRPKLIEELGDCAWYIALGCSVLGERMEDVLAANIEKLQKRYPQGFSAERSINREV